MKKQDVREIAMLEPQGWHSSIVVAPAHAGAISMGKNRTMG
jgi:hypothetical protein